MNDPIKETLEELHLEAIRLLLKRVKSGEATAADLAVARNILRDSNIQCLPRANPEMLQLADSIPFPTEQTA